MINRKQFVAGSLVVLGYFASGAPAVAESIDLAPAEDVNVCVAKVQDNADYSGAALVRHTIESSKRRPTGYSLEIETAVYADIEAAPIREYKAICVVKNGDTPLVFSIKQTGDTA